MSEKKDVISTNKENNFIDHVADLKRVTKVTKGGKRFAFAAFVISGNREGKVGIGLGKSREVSSAIAKATNKARKNLIEIPLREATLPYATEGRHGSTKVVVRPASKGTGIIAGGAVRAIMDAAGIQDILTKLVGSGDSKNAAKATLNALSKQRSAQHLAKLRGKKSVKDMVKGE